METDRFNQAWDAIRASQEKAAANHPPTVVKRRRGRAVQIAPSPEMNLMQELMADLCCGAITPEEAIGTLGSPEYWAARFA